MIESTTIPKRRDYDPESAELADRLRRRREELHLSQFEAVDLISRLKFGSISRRSYAEAEKHGGSLGNGPVREVLERYLAAEIRLVRDTDTERTFEAE